MSHIKRYFLLAILVMAACVLKFHHFGRDYESIDTFRGAQLNREDWNPLIAQSVNEKRLTISIDNKEYSNQDTGIFMDDNLNLMVPVDILSEGLNCSTHLYPKEELLIEKRDNRASFGLDNTMISVNDQVFEITSPMKKMKGTYYVSIGAASESIGYHYEWDVEQNKAVAIDTSDSTSIFPSSYDLRQRGRIGRVRNQGNTGTCWAFAALSALESSLLPEEEETFSPDHMSLGNSFATREEEGGEYTMGMAYLLSWQGPVLEEDDPFDGVLTEGVSAVKHVQEIQMIEGKDYEKIKEAVFKYGGVQTSLYSTLLNSADSSASYNPNEKAYCYIGTEKPNHEVVIIGWDDNFSKDNFPVNVEGDGAFICQNSWGKEFGEQGTFYVSYYDTNIGSHNVVYTKVEETDNYDHIYQSDLCGWVGQMGYNKDSVYGANVYTAEKEEELSSVGFYATGKDSIYTLYMVRDFQDTSSFEKKVKIAEGTLSNAGYYTIPVKQGIKLSPGEKFAVVLSIQTPNSIHPMAIEYVADESTRNVDISDGQGYISATGRVWDSVEEMSSCNLCLKAYTKDWKE
ncbi:MAG: lectin like domain-containing protein [Lachnospiraceae bacterium]|jgi:Cysteine protease|nr:lectin like domain-containing protein [Lachnospiraceae bacterium]